MIKRDTKVWSMSGASAIARTEQKVKNLLRQISIYHDLSPSLARGEV
jgi:hypothetical protein